MDDPSDDMPPATINHVINHSSQTYPFCIVWTPIPLLTWILPCIGHLGIATSSGIIRDFIGPYTVGTGNMGFGKPTRYLQLDPSLALDGVEGWDRAVFEASEIYKNKNHNLCFNNCHSHVATALNKMKYRNSTWNMVKVGFIIFFCGKYVSFLAALQSWAPFFIFVGMIILLCLWPF